MKQVGCDLYNLAITGDVAATLPTGGGSNAGPSVLMTPIAFNWQNGGGYGDANDGLAISEDHCAPLSRSQVPAVAFSMKDSGQDATEDLAPTLRAMPHDGSHANGGGQLAVAIPFDTTQVTSAANYSNPQPGDPCHPLAAHAPAVAFESRLARNGRGAPSEIVPPLKAQSGETGKGDGAPLALSGMQVRRLTPKECARLQGFPDDYLDITYRGKPAADGPKYKALGNSMAVPVMRWIGERIQMAEELTRE